MTRVHACAGMMCRPTMTDIVSSAHDQDFGGHLRNVLQDEDAAKHVAHLRFSSGQKMRHQHMTKSLGAISEMFCKMSMQRNTLHTYAYPQDMPSQKCCAR